MSEKREPYHIKLPPNMPYSAGHDEVSFELLENELHVLYDMLHARIKQAEKEVPENHSSHFFREQLLHKLTKAMIWSRCGSKVYINKES